MPNESSQALKAQVQAILHKARREQPRVFGFRVEGGWSAARTLDIDGDHYVVAPCRSSLEVRERLSEFDGQPRRLIIVTPLPESELGEDVVARLALRRLAVIDAWEGAVRLFQATRADGRLRREPWMANALIEAAPPGGYAAVPAGVLDRDTAWTAFLVHRLGFPDGRPDAVAILRRTLDAGGLARYESLDATVRQGVHARFEETAGLAGIAVEREARVRIAPCARARQSRPPSARALSQGRAVAARRACAGRCRPRRDRLSRSPHRRRGGERSGRLPDEVRSGEAPVVARVRPGARCAASRSPQRRPRGRRHQRSRTPPGR